MTAGVAKPVGSFTASRILRVSGAIATRASNSGHALFVRCKSAIDIFLVIATPGIVLRIRVVSHKFGGHKNCRQQKQILHTDLPSYHISTALLADLTNIKPPLYPIGHSGDRHFAVLAACV
jgi:hypothetical protein